MKNYRNVTIDTYNKSAQALADYFQGIGSRVTDIERAFDLAGNPKDPSVVEIGCGDGRDAKEIVRRTNNYVGFDISDGMIKIARNYVPEAHFEVADAVSYEYPKNTDIIFAFASLLHLDKEEVEQVLSSVWQSLNTGGIFYISSKYQPEYSEGIKKDQYGERLFYFYNADLMKEIACSNYISVFEDR
ncbi:MAG: class I SAM-dependent methyltransferase, partial [Candidatus Saccharimonadales bacterium]